jgi:hypothetical protein
MTANELHQSKKIYFLEFLYTNWSSFFIEIHCVDLFTYSNLLANSINTLLKVFTKLHVTCELLGLLYQGLFHSGCIKIIN